MARQKLKHEGRIRVGPGIAGTGVFATRKFRKGQVIGEITGKIVAAEGYASRYGMDLGHDRILEPGEPFRFMNHSCDPNAQIFWWYEEEDEAKPSDQLWVHALRTIHPGDELFIDYAWPAHFAIECHCASPKCRGRIVDAAELPELLRMNSGRTKGGRKSR